MGGSKAVIWILYRDFMACVKAQELLEYLKGEEVDFHLLAKIVEKLAARNKEESYGDRLVDIRNALLKRCLV